MAGGIDFKAVAAALSAEDFARSEMTLRGKRANCPFHGGTHYNLAFTRDGHAYCHKCHRVADTVQLAAAVWHTDQLSAAVELNKRFRLGVRETGPTEERQAVRTQRAQELDRLRQAVTDAQTEAAAAWTTVTRCQAGTPEHEQAMRQARNADVWVQFKAMELRNGGGAV